MSRVLIESRTPSMLSPAFGGRSTLLNVGLQTKVLAEPKVLRTKRYQLAKEYKLTYILTYTLLTYWNAY